MTIGSRLSVPHLHVVMPTDDDCPACLTYAIDELAEFCRRSPEIPVTLQQGDEATLRTDVRERVTLYVGHEIASKVDLPLENIDWSSLGEEGYLLRSCEVAGASTVIAAGHTPMGTRHAILDLLRSLDVTTPVPTLPWPIDRRESPTFPLRGMYAHQHWAYNHPYALRTWSIEEWKQYVDMLAIMGVNLFQIWSMAGILQFPLSEGDEAFLRRYPPVIDHARNNHGMTVFIGECANNMCRDGDVPPITERLYFDVEEVKDPSDPKQMQELSDARAAFYRICHNADGYWILDSDPGQWEGSPSSEFVDILMMNRELITQHTTLGAEAKLIYWMWIGWGTGEREDNWRATLTDMIARNPEPWWMTTAWEGHWKVTDELGLDDRIIYYPYGAIEPEPSMPYTTVVPDVIPELLNVPERVDRIRGIMGNAQTPLCQLPNMYFFTRASWDLDRRDADREEVMRELAGLIYPEQAELITRCWMSLGSPEAPDAEALADHLAEIESRGQLGRPGPIGLKLFPDFGQVARDLAEQLRIHGVAMRFCEMSRRSDDEASLLDQLKRYCLLSLAWRKRNGFRRYGTNGYNFFPLREAAHRHWWRGDHLDERVYTSLETAMTEQFDAWEAELILYPLNH